MQELIHALFPSDGMLWARVDCKELVSKKSGFVNCSEKKPSALCSASALRLVRCVFANLLINKRVKEQECYASSTLLLLFYFFISFSRRGKTNFIGTISRLCIRLFLATCWLNTEMTSWYHELRENKIYYNKYSDEDWIKNCTYVHSYTRDKYTFINHQMGLHGQMLDATVQCSCVRFKCTLLCFLQRVPIKWWVNGSFV